MARERKRRQVGPARTRRLRRMFLLGVAVGVAALAILGYATNALNSLDLSTVNARFSIRGTQQPPKDIVLVEIDETTFDKLQFQWPFPRRVDALVIDNIARDHPKAIAFDVQFSEPSACPTVGNKPPAAPGKCPQAQADELALLTALNNADGKVVMAATGTQKKGQFEFLGSSQGNALLAAVNSHGGSALVPYDAGGVIRRLQYAPDGLPTLSVVTSAIASGHRISPKAFDGTTVWIDYAGPHGTFPSTSFSKVYLGQEPPGFFKNKIVVIGPSAVSLQDVHATSTDAQMPGAEVQANAISTVLRNLPLRSAPDWVNLLLIVLLAVATPLASLRFGPVATMGLFAALAALFSVAVQLAFNNGVVVSYVYPMAALVLSTAGALTVHLITVAFERERVRDLFSRFVPEDVVGEVLAATGDGLRLGGVQRFATVMFTDLRGFTSSAENMSPDNVIEVLNVYLSEMSDAILDHGGTLVAYMGDGIMAVFGAPLPQADHADRALATAREMLAVRLPRFNDWMKERGLGEGYRMGIGLNTGRVMSGNVGSERRVEYTAVGDATNTAARIEGLTKGTPHQLMFSEATKDSLSAQPEDLVFVQEVQIRGRRQTTNIWSVQEGTDPIDESHADAPAGDVDLPAGETEVTAVRETAAAQPETS